MGLDSLAVVHSCTVIAFIYNPSAEESAQSRMESKRKCLLHLDLLIDWNFH